MKVNKKFLIAYFISFLIFDTLQAASFDCTKEVTSVENMICNDSKLSKLDEDLASLYKNALKSTDDKEKLKNEQKDWLKYDRNNCEGVECLEEAYNNQIEFLKSHVKIESDYYVFRDSSITIGSDLSFSIFSAREGSQNFCFIEGEKFIKENNVFMWEDKNCEIEVKKINANEVYLISKGCDDYCGMNVSITDGQYKIKKR